MMSDGSPVNIGPYDGFPVYDETYTEGWSCGSISGVIYTDDHTDEYPEGFLCGDGFVQAPDGSRAGLVWGPDEKYGHTLIPPEENRWGVYTYRYVRPVKTVEDLVFNFHAVLPDLQCKYAEAIARKQRTE